MSRQEDFNKQSDKYVNERKSFSVNDPYALKEIGEAHYQGCEHGYQYAIEKAFYILSQMLYTKRDAEHPAQHYTRSVESMGEFVSQTDFLNQFKQKMQ